MSYYTPQPRYPPKLLPRTKPVKSVPSGIGDEGIVGNWLFYYLKGGDHLHDFSPYKNHGTIYGASWKDGRYGWALDFDGVDDWVDIGDRASLDIGSGDSFTVSAWFYTRNTDKDQLIVGKGDDSGGVHYGWRLRIVAGVRASFAIDDGDEFLAVTDYDHKLKGNTWYRITGVVDRGVDEAYVYVNGELWETKDASTLGDCSNSYPVLMGHSEQRDWDLEGVMDEVRIYDRALSSLEIQAYYNRTKGIFGY